MRDIQKAKELYDRLHHEKHFCPDDKEYEDIMIHYLYGDVYTHGQLDMKLRELALIVVHATNLTSLALSHQLDEALELEVSPLEIREAIYQCTPYIGLGRVEEALQIVHDVFQEKEVSFTDSSSTVCEETRFEQGFKVQSEAFGRENIQSLHDHAFPDLKHIQERLSAHCFGDFYTRQGLDLKTRELLTFVMLATLGGCENQLRSHIQANLTVGNTREVLIETISQCQPYIGFPRTLNAIQLINDITL